MAAELEILHNPRMGDKTDTSLVYDLQSIGKLRMMALEGGISFQSTPYLGSRKKHVLNRLIAIVIRQDIFR